VELRSALAAYLNRVRGTNANPEAIVVTNGYAQAVSLLIGVLAARGATTLAVEDPSSSDDARPIARALGMNVVGVPVDGDGVRVDAVAKLDADVLILTPSHQWPTGGVLSPQARAAVLSWAQRTGALILEDDYDAEYRYDRAPVGAIQGLDPDRVAYAGTASKTLAPGFRLGWIVLPAELAGIAAGLHLVTWLPRNLGEETVIAAAAREGVAVAAVSPYRLSPGGRGGLIFGYSNLNERQIAEGVTRLARAISSLRNGTAPRA
jgi:DNA-binding transcriptional MocR family regulator